MTPKVGDTVRFLNSVGGGRVTRIDGQIAYVDEDGFETPALLRECVVVASGNSFYESATRKSAPKEEAKAAPAPAPKPSVAELPPAQETPEGEKLNIVLGFEPADIKRLSDTSFDAVIVNDSNFCLYLTVATRSRDDAEWTLRFAGLIEPAIQETLFEVTREMLPEIDRISIQALPFKKGRAFSRKAAIDFEARIDSTKFARLHCFNPNPYFDGQVIALDIVKDDLAQAEVKVSPEDVRRSLAQKQREDSHPAKAQKVSKSSKPTGNIIEVDLHAEALLDTLAGLSKADILNYQIDTFRRVMDENLRNPGQKIVFIHGKGEGVLRSALMKELNHRYKGHDVADASFREYGFGATQVTIRKVQR